MHLKSYRVPTLKSQGRAQDGSPAGRARFSQTYTSRSARSRETPTSRIPPSNKKKIVGNKRWKRISTARCMFPGLVYTIQSHRGTHSKRITQSIPTSTTVCITLERHSPPRNKNERVSQAVSPAGLPTIQQSTVRKSMESFSMPGAMSMILLVRTSIDPLPLSTTPTTTRSCFPAAEITVTCANVSNPRNS